jgi:hypothetical protein
MTTMKTLSTACLGHRQALPWAVHALAAIAGARWGCGFGDRVGGVLPGVVAALNLAVFCMIAVSALARWFDRRGPAGRRADG